MGDIMVGFKCTCSNFLAFQKKNLFETQKVFLNKQIFNNIMWVSAEFDDVKQFLSCLLRNQYLKIGILPKNKVFFP